MSLRILSIDGGGIRGIIPALVLAELERLTGRRTAELFDLIAGTSTGGILALALTCPGPDGEPRYRASEVVDLYAEDGPEIFSRSIWHRLRAVGSLAEEKYPSHGIEGVLRRKLGDARLAEAVTPVLVTAYDIERRGPHFFKSHRAVQDPSRNFLMRDAARATSAAPTYFEPAWITSMEDGTQPYALVDGGVYANNPAACAFVEAICAFGARPEQVDLLSLGTGELVRPLPYDDARTWGLANWAQPLLSVVFDGVSDTVNYQLQSIMGAVSRRYDRIQCALHEGNDDMDDAGATNIRMLRIVADEVIQKHRVALGAWAELLTADPGDDAAGTATVEEAAATLRLERLSPETPQRPRA